jgi:flavin-dependent dehydrogenase
MMRRIMPSRFDWRAGGSSDRRGLIQVLVASESAVRNVDLLIVGGGFAGLTCAQAAAARGVSTVVLERKRKPGDACHTTGLLVKEVSDAWDFPRNLTRKVHGIRLYSPNLKSIDFVSRGYYFLATDTPGLLRWMTGQAVDAGAEVQLGGAYEGAYRSNAGIQLEDHPLSARFLVGCDGARSRVARDFGLGRNRRFLVGVEGEFTGVTCLDEDRLHVFLDSHLAPGYIAWVVPGLDFTQVGLAVTQPHVPRLGPLVERLSRIFNFDRARLVGRRGGLIPCGGIVRPWITRNQASKLDDGHRLRKERGEESARLIHHGGVMLLGDAAGMVSPLTAGGIHPAMRLGRAAGIALSDYLLEAGQNPDRVLRSLVPSFTFKQFLRIGFNLEPPDWLYDVALGSRAMRNLAQTLFFHHRGLFSLDAWRDILRLRVKERAG